MLNKTMSSEAESRVSGKKLGLIILPMLILIISGCSLPWQAPQQVGCDLDAKLCPDGSAVGRSGPNCEFAACPQIDINPAITDFNSCSAAGYPIMESYPRQCRANGRTYTERLIDNNSSSCTISPNCQLPMDYAVRSNCPYQAYCYNQKCVVGCPLWDEPTNSWEVKCSVDKDCNCAAWNEQENYTCACVDGQCASIVSGPSSEQPGPAAGDYAADCLKNNGNWLEQYRECEYSSQTWCDQAGGVFKECESACRHDPQAQMCTLQCVPVCQLK